MGGERVKVTVRVWVTAWAQCCGSISNHPLPHLTRCEMFKKRKTRGHPALVLPLLKHGRRVYWMGKEEGGES